MILKATTTCKPKYGDLANKLAAQRLVFLAELVSLNKPILRVMQLPGKCVYDIPMLDSYMEGILVRLPLITKIGYKNFRRAIKIHNHHVFLFF